MFCPNKRFSPSKKSLFEAYNVKVSIQFVVQSNSHEKRELLSVSNAWNMKTRIIRPVHFFPPSFLSFLISIKNHPTPTHTFGFSLINLVFLFCFVSDCPFSLVKIKISLPFSRSLFFPPPAEAYMVEFFPSSRGQVNCGYHLPSKIRPQKFQNSINPIFLCDYLWKSNFGRFFSATNSISLLIKGLAFDPDRDRFLRLCHAGNSAIFVHFVFIFHAREESPPRPMSWAWLLQVVPRAYYPWVLFFETGLILFHFLLYSPVFYFLFDLLIFRFVVMPFEPDWGLKVGFRCRVTF